MSTTETLSARHYENFAALYEAHETLLIKQESGAPVVTMLGDVSEFIDRARHTGILLYVSDHRSVAQALIDYWSSMVDRADRKIELRNLVRFNPEVFPLLAESECPFVGLEAFREQQGHLFFGRQRVVDVLAERTQSSRFIAVLGLSGSGKSSLVVAGLLPILRNGGPGNHGPWNILPVIVPGAEPLQNLAAAVRAEGETVESVMAQLRDDPKSLRGRLTANSLAPACLVVDQFEELFTLCFDDGNRRAFVEALLDLAEGGDIGHVVIVTMRSDYEDSVSYYPALQRRFLNEVRVGSLLDEELREVIVRPADQVKLVFDPGLVERLVADTRGETAALPLLQFTLRKLWDARDRNRLTNVAYEALGNVRVALANCADELSRNLSEENRGTMRRIFLRIVRPATGVEVIRKRVRRCELSQGEPRERFDFVLSELRAQGLVRYTAAEPDSESQIEIPHEALVRNWRQLREWIDQQRADMAMRDFLERAAHNWNLSGRRIGFLDEGRISGAQQWLDSTAAVDLGATELITNYVRASQEEIKRLRNAKMRVAVNRIAIGASLLIILIIAAAMWVIQSHDQQRELKLSKANAERQRAEAQKAWAEAEAARLSKERAEAENRTILSKSEHELASLIRDGQLRELDARRKELDLQNGALRAANARLETTEETLRRELRESQASARELGASNGRLNSEVATQRALASSLRIENQRLQTIIDSLKSEENSANSLPLPPKDESIRIGGAISTGRPNAPRGSVCCVVKDDDGRRYILTMASVLAVRQGDLVIQPARDGRSRERIGVVWKSGSDPLNSGALALPLDGVVADRTIPEKGRFRGTDGEPEDGQEIEMIGAGSGSKQGVILRATDEKILTNIAATAADIGAPIFDRRRELIGLVGSVENNNAIALPIRRILQELDVRLDWR